MKTKILTLSAENQPQVVAEAADAVASGGIVAFATETVYGLAALASDASALERLRELKGRPLRPFSVHLGCADDVSHYVADVPAPARRLIAKAWPGPLTLLLPTGGQLADASLQEQGLYDVLCHDGVIGLRCPAWPSTREMLSAIDAPVIAPSANRPGNPSPLTAGDVLRDFDGEIDLLLDSGPTPLGRGSTVVQVRGERCEVLREGAIARDEIERLLRMTYLFVCTGNTCRSPMAAGVARKILAETYDVPADQLEQANVEVLSAGVYAFDGSPASPQAVEAASQLGADIRHHRSQKLTPELINRADVIFCMEQQHVSDVQRFAPWAAGKVRPLSPQGDISDPIGSGTDVYRDTADQIYQLLRKSLFTEVS